MAKLTGPRRRFRWATLGLSLAVGLAAAYGLERSWTNLREVDPGRFYRSAQLRDSQLRDVIDEYGIRTVVNLRGRDEQDASWRDEAAVAREKGVSLIDIRFSARRLPHRDDLLRLLDAYQAAERPILVHCFSGADRAGQASAIYQMEYMEKSKHEALEMLSVQYLHLAWFRPAMRYFIELYEGEQWARTAYDPCRADYLYYDKERYCRE